jgi:hypothetical protein
LDLSDSHGFVVCEETGERSKKVCIVDARILGETPNIALPQRMFGGFQSKRKYKQDFRLLWKFLAMDSDSSRFCRREEERKSIGSFLEDFVKKARHIMR